MTAPVFRTWSAGEIVTDTEFNSQIRDAGNYFLSTLGAITPLYARKVNDQTVTNSTTPVNDTELLMSVAANTAYSVMCCVFLTVSADANDIKTQWAFPSNATLNIGGMGPDMANTTFTGTTMFLARVAVTSSPTVTIAYGGIAAAPLTIWMMGSIITGVTPGTLQLQWSENTGGASTTTTVKAGSWLRLERMA
jgi:hypothetical protein